MPAFLTMIKLPVYPLNVLLRVRLKLNVLVVTMLIPVLNRILSRSSVKSPVVCWNHRLGHVTSLDEFGNQNTSPAVRVGGYHGLSGINLERPAPLVNVFCF